MADAPLPIIIAGAGPTGLLLSIWLHHFSIPHRIVDPKPTTGSFSRALIVHARTLECYHQLGFGDAIVAAGERLRAIRIRYGGEEKVTIDTGTGGRGRTRYPFALCLEQDQHEAMLYQEIKKRGGDVEWRTKVTAAVDKGEYVAITLESPKGTEVVPARYVAGCDGAQSTVRKATGLKMEGGTYARRFFVADARGSGPVLNVDPSINMCLAKHDFCVVHHMNGDSAVRLVGFAPEGAGEDVTYEQCLPSILNAIGKVDIQHVDWFSHYKVHHRHVERFRAGRMFLFGDAAHLHSPAGGQGMNTGLGDVSNFAWKFATHLKTPGGNEALLDTYHTERSAFAKLLVSTTDAVFSRMTGPGLPSRILRSVIMPYIAPLVARMVDLAPIVFGKTSQLAIAYPQSPVSQNVGKGGKVKAGDRLPYVEYTIDGKASSNHDQLDGKGWVAHVYASEGEKGVAVLDKLGVAVHTYKWEAKACGSKGLVRDVVYIVRPDGHVGLVLGGGVTGREGALSAYVDEWGLALLSA